MKSINIAFALMIALSVACDATNKPIDGINHAFSNIFIPDKDRQCSYEFSPINFCDPRRMNAINHAIKTKNPNFNHHFILLYIKERDEYFQRSLVVIDTKSGVVYPLPFDFYSGPIDRDGNPKEYGTLKFSLDSNKICLNGTIVAYREGDTGNLCWSFDGKKFTGHRTPYMD